MSDYATTSRLDDLRAAEYSYLDRGGISVRTGCFCNPGAGEWAFGLTGGRYAAPGGAASPGVT